MHNWTIYVFVPNHRCFNTTNHRCLRCLCFYWHGIHIYVIFSFTLYLYNSFICLTIFLQDLQIFLENTTICYNLPSLTSLSTSPTNSNYVRIQVIMISFFNNWVEECNYDVLDESCVRTKLHIKNPREDSLLLQYSGDHLVSQQCPNLFERNSNYSNCLENR